jgi:hypothetical protein
MGAGQHGRHGHGLCVFFVALRLAGLRASEPDEGVQFGTIQGWIGPPEFLVGIDERYEVLSAPGLFSSREQYQRTIDDPTVRDLILALGGDKGLLGASSIAGDLSASKPALNATVKVVFAAAARNK